MIEASASEPGKVYRHPSLGLTTYLRPRKLPASKYLARLRKKGQSANGRDSFWIQLLAQAGRRVDEDWLIFATVRRCRSQEGQPVEYTTTTPFPTSTRLRPLKSPPPYPPRRS